MTMMRVVPLFVGGTLLAAPAAQAQTLVGVPPVEISLVAVERAGIGAAGPAVTFNLSRDTAVEVGTDVSPESGDPSIGFRHTGYFFHGRLRQRLFTAGRASISGLLGGGAGYRDFTIPAHTYQLGDQVFFVPEQTYRDDFGVMTIGAGATYNVARFLALRGDVEVMLGSDTGLRAAAGVSVPLGGYTFSRADAGGDAGAFGDVRPGRVAWVTTTDGREHEGVVANAEAGRVVLFSDKTFTNFAADEIVRIETPDGLGNGMKWGAIAGGATTGTLATLFTLAFCTGGGDDCGEPAAFLITTTAFGAGMGVVAGAIVDRLIEGRQTVYARDGARPSIGVSPLFVKGGGGVGATFAWR
jgi:hypothetical protein